ncbi:6-O-methylguanine DNA methyltransferase [Alkalilimnicola ehrlichii]|uniref:methylated-DNA--[protein]-cysteine S-methyltransferase n=2 Tax=Alkalilimnicola ehrlichii TaxID=351052 RepID=A0A3E0WT70_9GAMM|nr:6-O-methylguanine DNA methyltransferase [Alkalilimnicola ehrlichii]
MDKAADYERIAKAMHYIRDRVADQPSLAEIAAHVHMSPFHFQRLFCRWAGTTPKRFLQVLTLERIKRLLAGEEPLLNVSEAAGLSSSSRLYDHFVRLEAVTPGEYRSGGEGLRIDCGVHPTPFGSLFVAMTAKGVCRATFLGETTLDEELKILAATWPRAVVAPAQEVTAAVVSSLFGAATTPNKPISLSVSGTNLQIAVWRALLRIPRGYTVSYSQLAATVGAPGAARAVGNAVGANPVAFFIPCHRVIRQSGALGGYRWGEPRKRIIQIWEYLNAAQSTDNPAHPAPVRWTGSEPVSVKSADRNL